MIKWIAAFLGYFMFRFPGAVLGFIVGTFLDNLGGSGSRSGSIFENVTRQ
ncbi:MAG: molecular chaperone DjiA, partial [Muricauda sp.]|nr:molecular chaperone DjiA [Allomuricauda sp.]